MTKPHDAGDRPSPFLLGNHAVFSQPRAVLGHTPRTTRHEPVLNRFAYVGYAAIRSAGTRLHNVFPGEADIVRSGSSM